MAAGGSAQIAIWAKRVRKILRGKEYLLKSFGGSKKLQSLPQALPKIFQLCRELGKVSRERELSKKPLINPKKREGPLEARSKSLVVMVSHHREG